MSVGKGIGKIYQQTAIETYSNVGFAKLYSEKTAVTAADLLNGRVLPFFDQYETLSLLEYSLTVGQNIAGEKKKSLSIIPLLKRD